MNFFESQEQARRQSRWLIVFIHPCCYHYYRGDRYRGHAVGVWRDEF